MAYQETTRQSYGSKVKNSFQGILWGLILIIAGTVILWWNEGRAVKASDALKEFQKNYVELSDISTIDPSFEGKAIHAIGVAATADTLRDAAFGIAVNAMRLNRNVEYYQWTQKSSSESKDKLGGSTETTTTYTYEPAWCGSPVNSNDFKDPDYKGKNFVLRSVEKKEQTAANAMFGAYRLTPGIVGRISGEEPAYPSLTDEQKKQLLTGISDTTVVVTISGDQVYIGSDPAAPRIGDVRITFTQVTSPKTISLLQKVVNGTFESYVAKNGKQVSKVETGTVSAENMIESQKSTNKTMLWLFRILGIILVLAGNRSLLSFISTIFAVVPFIQRIIGTGVNLVATIIGLVWSVLVIAVAWVAYRPVLAICLLVIAAALIVLLVRRSRKKKVVDVAAVLAICLMIGVSCTGKTGDGDSDMDYSDVKGPVSSATVTLSYGEGLDIVTVYQYDEHGKVISEKDESLWEEERYGIIEELSVKDARGNYTKEVWGDNGEIFNYSLHEYDEAGNLLSSVFHNANGTVSASTQNTYDGAGNLTFSTYRSDNSVFTTANEWDGQGRMTKTTHSTNGKVTTVTTFQYDDAGRLVLTEETQPALGQSFKNYTSYDRNGEVNGTMTISTDPDGISRVSSRDTIFTDKNGMRHRRSYSQFNQEETSCEATYNKEDYLTHYACFEGSASQPNLVIDFKFAPDNKTLREIVWKRLILGQEKETLTRSFSEKEDTFGNWTRKTQGLTYSSYTGYSDFESLLGELPMVTRKFVYRGADQGNNYGFSGQAGQARIRLTCTNDDDVLCGELTVDGNMYRAVGTLDNNDQIYVVALMEDGTIPWSLTIPAGSGKREATLAKGEETIKATLSPVRDGLKTYNFSTVSDELPGIYEFRFPGNGRSGQLHVSLSGENWETINFDICNTEGTSGNRTACDNFSQYQDNRTSFYQYLWNDDSQEHFRYIIRFFDNFAVICAYGGNPTAFFGHGMTLEGIYAKLPSFG